MRPAREPVARREAGATMNQPRSLGEWLVHAESVHEVGIDMGLGRVGQVAERLGFTPPSHRPAPKSIIVAGTNGKGSTCIAIEALLHSAGLRVGTTLSPHVHRFNERVRIGGRELDDDSLCRAFEAVESARGDVGLTYFEFSTLVALWSFRNAGVDVAVLEVGLGGRLDAFNLVSADVAVITSIGLDHQAYLGDDVESIGREKAGVLRPGQRAVLGADVTASVTAEAARLDCSTSRLGQDFRVEAEADTWRFVRGDVRLPAARGTLAPDSCALAVEAASALVPIGESELAALSSISFPGRLEIWHLADPPGAAGPVRLLLDVAHNPAAARFLARQIDQRSLGRRFVGVLGMLADKDAAGVAAALDGRVTAWVCVSTSGPRGRSGAELASALGSRRVQVAPDLQAGLDVALSSSAGEDGILALGSFNVVEQVRDLLSTGFAGAAAHGMAARVAAGEAAGELPS